MQRNLMPTDGEAGGSIGRPGNQVHLPKTGVLAKKLAATTVLRESSPPARGYRNLLQTEPQAAIIGVYR
jgi:hypothetical protein